jgi:LCP family protein required for cell wall assembly
MTNDTVGQEQPSPNASSGSQRAPRRRRRLNVARFVAVIAVLAAVAAVGIGVRQAGGVKAFLLQMTGRVVAVVASQKTQTVAPVRPTDPVTMLVLGLETAPGYAGPKLTDSMMVWSYDPASKKAAILSVPRDLWVDIPGVGMQRINAAYEDAGPAAAELTVEKYIGVPIQYYAIVDYAALVKLVNDVGGINVDVPYNIYDPCYPNVAENKCTVYKISAGMHHMDGAQALQFARERHSVPEGDLTRESDQQIVLFALKKALLQPSNIFRLPTIIGDMEQLITTNLPASQWVNLADQVLKLPKSSIPSAAPTYQDGTVSNYTTSGGADVLLPHPAAIAKLVQSLFGPILGYMTQAEVQVENGAPTSQPLATYFSQVLQGMGVTTLPAEQAARTDYAKSEVIWNTAVAKGQQPPTLAYMLAQMVNARILQQPMPSTAAPIVVILGKNFPKVKP